MIPKRFQFTTMTIIWVACIIGAICTYVSGALIYGMFSWTGGVFFALMVDHYMTHRKGKHRTT